MTIMVNIITDASKTESLLFNVSLLRFGTTARGTVANLKILCLPQMDYFFLRSGLRESERQTS